MCLKMLPKGASVDQKRSRERNGDAEEIQRDPGGRIIDYSTELLENLEPRRDHLGTPLTIQHPLPNNILHVF